MANMTSKCKVCGEEVTANGYFQLGEFLGLESQREIREKIRAERKGR